MAELCQSFSYSADSDARILILGSMPGVKSLQANQYYAHAQNAFWPIIEALFQIKASASYEERLNMLRANHVALWDVLACCKRQGSLDSNIETDSIVVNDFKSLFAHCPKIHTVFFNGKTAESLFKKHVIKNGHINATSYKFIALPSTSPAHASLTREQKIKIWKNEVLKA